MFFFHSPVFVSLFIFFFSLSFIVNKTRRNVKAEFIPEERLNSSQIHLNRIEEFFSTYSFTWMPCAPTNRALAFFSTILPFADTFSFQRQPYYLSLPARKCIVLSWRSLLNTLLFNCIEKRALIIEKCIERCFTKICIRHNFVLYWEKKQNPDE